MTLKECQFLKCFEPTTFLYVCLHPENAKLRRRFLFWCLQNCILQRSEIHLINSQTFFPSPSLSRKFPQLLSNLVPFWTTFIFACVREIHVLFWTRFIFLTAATLYIERLFDSGNAVHREAFTPPPPQKMDKKSRQKAESSFTECIEIFGIWTKGIRLFVCALHKQNK